MFNKSTRDKEILNIIKELITCSTTSKLRTHEKDISINFGLFICHIKNDRASTQLIISCNFKKNSIEYTEIDAGMKEGEC